MVFQGGRSVVRLPQLTLQHLGNRRTALSSSCVERVPALYKVSQSPQYPDPVSTFILRTLILRRNYAQGAVSRPKAHTGRTTTAATRKAPTTSKTTAAKKPAPKKTTPKAVPKAKSNAKPRINAKPKRAKKKKATKKPKPKVKKPKVLTAAQKLALATKKLKETALKPPIASPHTAWMVFVGERVKPVDGVRRGTLGGLAKEASRDYKELTPERLEHYNHLANQNKAANATVYRQWIESYTPTTIHGANNARKYLRRLGLVKGMVPLHDHRQVKGKTSSFIHFYKQRYQSGDYRGLKTPEAARLGAREWRGLSASEKKPFQDLADQDMVRYTQEMKTVMNKDVRHHKVKA